MAGLDPVIHLLRKILGRLMDPRIKGPGVTMSDNQKRKVPPFGGTSVLSLSLVQLRFELTSAFVLLAGLLARVLVLLARVLVLLARILVLVRHRDLPG